MSSPTETRLRELPCSRPVLGALHEVPSKPIYLAPDKPQLDERSPGFMNASLDMILGPGRRTKKRPALSVKRLEARLAQCIGTPGLNAAVVESSAVRKMLAVVCLATGKELEACCHLIASHAACLRQQIFYRHLKSRLRTNVLREPMVNSLDPNDLDVDHRNSYTDPKNLMSTLKELPSEWYVLQITAEHEHLKDVRHRFQNDDYMYALKPTHGLHIVALSTGKDAVDPICITVPKPNVDSTYDIRTEIETLLNSNKSDLTADYGNRNLYWKMRKKQNDQMSMAIWELEYSWLREWRILLLADYIEQLDLVQDIHDMIDKLLADASVKDVTARTRWLLRKIATGACHLRPFEIERAVKYVLPTQKKLAKNIVLSIIAKSKIMEPLKEAKRKTVILILDECLDHISFESVQLLRHQPVTRLPSLHILYALFKQHKSSIKDGYKIIRQSDKLGTFIINPSLDLTHMECRMRAFMSYWLFKWQGLFGVKPDLEFFKNALTEYDILMYSGHGSGIQFLRGEEIEKMRVLALVLLFGCSSIKLLPVGGRQAPYGISNQYLMACSPCILGMLWEVTDGDIDRMTAEFMSTWISSTDKRPWSDVDQTAWNKGTIEFTKASAYKIVNEQDMLIAVAKSKDVCKQYMTSAAIIVRGLPVKLVQ